MAELAMIDKDKRFNFNWVPEVFFKPRRIFQRISSSTSAVWITPLLLISIFALGSTLIAGKIKFQSSLSGEISYPPDFQYYSPEQQAQYMQAIQSTQGPVFVYVLPSITSLLGIWIGWLLLGGMLHLVATLFGGRGTIGLSMNIVAWASLPLALRSLVQIIYMLVTQNLISSPGLSGFSPSSASGIMLFFSQLLRLIDIYIVWQILLLIYGVKQSTVLSIAKSTSSVIVTVAILIGLQAGLSYAISLLGTLSIARPFFF